MPWVQQQPIPVLTAASCVHCLQSVTRSIDCHVRLLLSLRRRASCMPHCGPSLGTLSRSLKIAWMVVEAAVSNDAGIAVNRLLLIEAKERFPGVTTAIEEDLQP